MGKDKDGRMCGWLCLASTGELVRDAADNTSDDHGQKTKVRKKWVSAALTSHYISA